MRPIEFFDRSALAHPERACMWFGDIEYSYRDVHGLTVHIARGLRGAGIRAGWHGAVLSPNHPEAFACTLGLMRAGVVWLPINPRNSPADNGALLADLDCRILFYHSVFEGVIATLRKLAPEISRYVCIDAESENAPSLAQWIAGHLGDHNDTASSDPSSEVDDDPEAVVAIPATGGTTGTPKGVMLTNKSFETFTRAFLEYLVHDEPPVYLAAASMTHVSGRICFTTMAAGGTVVVVGKPDPQTMLQLIPEREVTHLFLPPTAIYKLLAQPNVADIDYSSLQHFAYGSAPMSVAMLERALKIFGRVMTQGYGQTEAPMLIAQMQPEDHYDGDAIASALRLQSCGRPTSFADVAIMDDDGGILPVGETGEIVVRGDFLMKGYYRDPEATAATRRNGWHLTGDIGYFDEDGFLYIVDRKKDMIITGGFNVYSSQVEQAISALPQVQACAVIGVPDDKWGEAVKAVIELVPGAELEADAVIAHCKEQMGSVKAPKSVDFVAELPRSSIGKILKRAVREDYWQGRDRQV